MLNNLTDYNLYVPRVIVLMYINIAYSPEGQTDDNGVIITRC